MAHFSPPQPGPESESDVESAMRTTSLVVSVVALALMVGGLVQITLFGDAPRGDAHYSVVPLAQFAHPLTAPPGLLAMSVGVVLLCLLPAVRVILAFVSYVRRRRLGDALVALLVLIELIFGMQTGR